VDSKHLKTIVRRTQAPADVAPPHSVSTTSRHVKLNTQNSNQQAAGWKNSADSPMTPRMQELQISLQDVVVNPPTSKGQNAIQLVGIRALGDVEDDRHFKFGDCSGLPAEIVEMAKDTIRGVLVDYYAQNMHSGLDKGQLLAATSDKNIVEASASHLEMPRYRRILQQSIQEKLIEKALGLVTITTTSTQWRLGNSQGEGSRWSYTETRLAISLDLEKAWLPCRLFCTTTSRLKLHYQPNFDPILRVCNWIKHDAPIVVALQRWRPSHGSDTIRQPDSVTF
jgi:hypothetical protein